MLVHITINAGLLVHLLVYGGHGRLFSRHTPGHLISLLRPSSGSPSHPGNAQVFLGPQGLTRLTPLPSSPHLPSSLCHRQSELLIVPGLCHACCTSRPRHQLGLQLHVPPQASTGLVPLMPSVFISLSLFQASLATLPVILTTRSPHTHTLIASFPCFIFLFSTYYLTILF